MNLLCACALGTGLSVDARQDAPVDPPETKALFADPSLADWSHRVFDGETLYESAVGNAPEPLRQVHANTTAAASGRFLEVELDPQRWRHLGWAWQVDAPVIVDDVRTHAGDDFAARVYVVFSGGWAPWRSTSLVYVWGDADAPEGFWPNPYTDQARMMAVTRGPGRSDWTYVERDLVEDYRTAFDRDPPEIVAIAIMTDTDQTGARATARYGDLKLKRATASAP